MIHYFSFNVNTPCKKSHIILAKIANHSVTIVNSLLIPIFKYKRKKNIKYMKLKEANIKPEIEYFLDISEIENSVLAKRINAKKFPKNEKAAPITCIIGAVFTVNIPTIIVPIDAMNPIINALKIILEFPFFSCKNLIK